MNMANPFKPSAGAMPPILIGRRHALDLFHDMLAGMGETRLLLTGNSGVGKTVLLTMLDRMGENHGWTSVDETASHGWVERVENRSIQTGVDERLLVTVDEIQAANRDELTRFDRLLERLGESRRMVCACAGLTPPCHGIRAKRIIVGPLPEMDVAEAFTLTFARTGITITPVDARRMAAATHGYAYMTQLVGYHVWRTVRRHHGHGPVAADAGDVTSGIRDARIRLARNMMV